MIIPYGLESPFSGHVHSCWAGLLSKEALAVNDFKLNDLVRTDARDVLEAGHICKFLLRSSCFTPCYVLTPNTLLSLENIHIPQRIIPYILIQRRLKRFFSVLKCKNCNWYINSLKHKLAKILKSTLKSLTAFTWNLSITLIFFQECSAFSYYDMTMLS